MRYRDTQLLHRLASEYVLGTLQGRARRRFERVLTRFLQARAAVWYWERQLAPLHAAVASDAAECPRVERDRAPQRRHRSRASAGTSGWACGEGSAWLRPRPRWCLPYLLVRQVTQPVRAAVPGSVQQRTVAADRGSCAQMPNVAGLQIGQ